MKLPDFGNTKVVFLTKYGSHLYGTSTPESDMDLKGVFMPTADEILLGRIPKTKSFNTKSSAKGEKNTADDVDCELYSFGYFLELAASGQTVALEMLWSCPVDETKPPSHLLVVTSLWQELVWNRGKFLTKNMKAFMGYAKSQAVKYSLKGDKLNTAKKMVVFFETLTEVDKQMRLFEQWTNFQVNFADDPNVDFTEDQGGVKMMVVCKRALQESITVKYALEIMNKVVSQYGKRAKQAAEHDGADFKALSHAYRISLELRDLYSGSGLEFPFCGVRVHLLKEMKRGQFTIHEIMNKLDVVLAEVEDLAANSDLPEKVDRKFCDQILLNAHKEVLNV